MRIRSLLACSLAVSGAVAAVACGGSGSGATTTDGGGGPPAPEGAPGPDGALRENDAGGVQSDGAGAGGDGAADSEPPPRFTVSVETVSAMAQSRTFTLVVPATYDAGRSYPLVFAFHGDGESGAYLRGVMKFEEASAEDAIVVYPDGTAGDAWDLYTPEASNADDAFVDAMVAAIKAKLSIDATRVFGVGFSSGAFFVNQLACRRTGFFRAIGPSSGGAPYEPNDPGATTWKPDYTKCANQTGGVPAIVFHGAADTTVDTSSGDFTAQYWAYVDGCNEAAAGRTAVPPPPCKVHASCPAGTSVVYCEIPGLAHAVWSESSKAAWSFFANL